MLTARRLAPLPAALAQRLPRAALPAVLVSSVLVALYVVVYPARRISVGIGSDTPFYTWWARSGAALGLSAPGRGRPGVVGLLAALAGGLGQPAAAVVAAVAPVLAVATALGVGALLGAAGADRRLAWLAAFFSGVFLSLLVPGWLSTLAFGAAFLACLACLAAGLGATHAAGAAGSPAGARVPGSPAGRAPGRGRRATAAAAVLLGAAGLLHPLFLALGGLVLVGGGLALLPAFGRDRAAGWPAHRTALGQVLAVGAAGAALTAGGLGASLLVREGPLGPADISRDAALRRLGLPGLVARSFGDKLRHDFPWYRAVAAAAAALGWVPAVLWSRRRTLRGLDPRWWPPTAWPGSLSSLPDPAAFALGAGASWLAATVVGVAGLLAGIALPGQRLAAFCLPVPVLAAAAVLALGRRRPTLPLAVLAGTLFVAAFWVGWAGQPTLLSPRAEAQARAAAAALASRPPGTPLVLLADSDWPRPGLQVVRFENYLRAAVPGARVGDVHVFVGTVPDFLARRPTLTGNLEHDRLAEAAWAEIRPRLARGAVVVALEGFDPEAHREATALPGARALAPGAVLLPGSAPPAPPAPVDPAFTEPGVGTFSPWTPVWLAPLLLTVLAGVGWPWVRLALPGTDPSLRAALAPALGAAAVALASVVVDAVGLRLAEGGAPASLALAGLLPWTLAAPEARG